MNWTFLLLNYVRHIFASFHKIFTYVYGNCICMIVTFDQQKGPSCWWLSSLRSSYCKRFVSERLNCITNVYFILTVIHLSSIKIHTHTNGLSILCVRLFTWSDTKLIEPKKSSQFILIVMRKRHGLILDLLWAATFCVLNQANDDHDRFTHTHTHAHTFREWQKCKDPFYQQIELNTVWLIS